MGDAFDIAEAIILDQQRYLDTGDRVVEEIEENIQRREQREFIQTYNPALADILYPQLRDQQPLPTPRRAGRPSILNPEDTGYIYRETPPMRRREEVEMDNILRQEEELLDLQGIGMGEIPRETGTRAERREANRLLDERMRADNLEILALDVAPSPRQMLRGGDDILPIEEAPPANARTDRLNKLLPFIAGAGVLGAGAMGVAYALNKMDRLKEDLRDEETKKRDAKLRQFYSALASKAYPKNTHPLPKGVKEMVEFEIQDDMAKVFELDNKIFIAYKGTDRLAEVVPDIGILGGKTLINLQLRDDKRLFGKRFQDALDLFDEVQQKYPDRRITVAGHSLGGSLAKHVASLRNTHGYMFNAGASPLDMRGAKRTTNFITSDDSISIFNRYVGRGRVIKHNPEEGRAIRLGVVSGNLIERHGIDNFRQESFGGKTPDVEYGNYDFLNLLESESGRKMPTSPDRDALRGAEQLGRLFDDGDDIDPEELVLADLGIFDNEDEIEVEDDKRNTIALDGDPVPDGIFQKYVPSTFTDLSVRKTRAFTPNNRPLDKDGDGFISFGELKSFLKGRSDAEVRRIFKLLDTDGDGRIDERELLKLDLFI